MNGRYNQIANFVLAQSEINIAIKDKRPEQYFREVTDQCNGGKKLYGGITSADELRANLHAHCLPESLLYGEITPSTTVSSPSSAPSKPTSARLRIQHRTVGHFQQTPKGVSPRDGDDHTRTRS